MYTGDIGEIDENGFLKITDRKKDIIITAGGKNIAPQNIENILKTSQYISQAVVIGDKRPYLTALLTLNQDEIIKYAQEKNIKYEDYKQLINTQEIKELVSKIVDEKNNQLARFETIKKYKILDQDFSIETGELTPTLKVKRKIVNDKFKNLIEEMYSIS
jgi:long-chain acyl-CoA synthetase